MMNCQNNDLNPFISGPESTDLMFSFHILIVSMNILSKLQLFMQTKTKEK